MMDLPTQYLCNRIHQGRFEVLDQIASGAFKTVWAAHDWKHHQLVALSILRKTDNPRDARQRFEQESQILRSLTRDLPAHVSSFSGRIIGLLDAGELHEGPPFEGPYITTPLKVGMTLEDVQKKYPDGMPWSAAVRLAIGIVEALMVCHVSTPHRGTIIHRDLKPANIMVSPRQEVTVLDFGVSKMVMDVTHPEQSAIVGTACYMAPEQFQIRGSLGPATDFYGLGVILHELITGVLPWPMKSLRQILEVMKQRERGTGNTFEVLNAHVLPDGLRAMIADLLALRPEDRPSSAEDIRNELLKILDEEPSGVVPIEIEVNHADILNVETVTIPPADEIAPTKVFTPTVVRESPPWSKLALFTGIALLAFFAGWTYP